MEDYKELTTQDYIDAKTDEKAFEKVYKAHKKLIYSAIKKVHILPQFDFSQYEALLVEGFWTAVRTFEPEKGYKFSTYAVKCMQNEVGTFNRKQISKKEQFRQEILSFETMINSGYDKKRLYLGDTISDGSFEQWHGDYTRDVADPFKLLTYASEREQKLLCAVANGESRRKIAENETISFQRVCAIVNKTIKRLKTINDLAVSVEKLSRLGYDNEKIAENLNLHNENVSKFYLEVYNYLYKDAPRPTDIAMWIRTPYIKEEKPNNVSDDSQSERDN